MKPKGFSLAEMLATVVIVGILYTLIVVYFPNYGARVASIVKTGNIETLNKALELYKVQGGVKLSHSLAGTNINNTTGKTAIINALKTGFTLGGIKQKFLENTFNLSTNDVATNGSGRTLAFIDALSVGSGYAYFKFTITKRYTGSSVAIQFSELKLKYLGSDVAWPSGTTATGLHAAYTPASASEGASKLIDGLTSTKYCDLGFDGTTANNATSVQTGSAILLFTVGSGQSLVADAFDWANANDTNTNRPREPISWTLQGSVDNATWVTLYTKSDWTPSTFANNAWVGPFSF